MIRASSRSSVELLYLVGHRGAQGYAGYVCFFCPSSSTYSVDADSSSYVDKYKLCGHRLRERPEMFFLQFIYRACFMSVGLLDSTCYQCYQVRELLLPTININTTAVDVLLHISSTPGYQAPQNIKYQNYKPDNKKLLFGESLRFLFVTQGQVTFIYQDSCPPNLLKLVFIVCFFLFMPDIQKG